MAKDFKIVMIKNQVIRIIKQIKVQTLVTFLLLFLAPSSPAEPCAVRYIPARDYFQTVSAEINSARHSIHAILYLFSLYPNSPQSQPMQLANALVAAQKRGVDVDIVLDKGNYSQDHGDPAEAGDNREAYEYLTARGVHACFADVPAIVHAKALIIDSQTVILGSANWSESALTRNFEASALIHSTEVAQALLQELGGLKEKILVPVDSVYVKIPMAFMSDTGSVGRMAKGSDERAYDLYLYLCRLASAAFSSHRQLSPSSPSTFFDLNYDSCAAQLGILSTGREEYRRQINKVLDKLQDRYGLASVTTVYGKDAQIRLADADSDTSRGTVSVPAGYWDYGWGRRLGLPGKVMYLLGLYYSSVSLSRPQWSMAATTIAKRHGLTRGFVSTGTIELRRANLIDVLYDEQTPVGPRHSNRYTPLPLYDPAKLAARWAELENKYGKEKTDRGRACATAVYKDDDCGAVEKFIGLEEKYGIDKVEKARKIMEQKNGDNPKRCVGYFIKTIMAIK